MDASIKSWWNNRALGYVLVCSVGVAAVVLFFSTETSVGVGVAILGLAAAITAIRELSAPEKALWMFVFFVLLGAELRAINRERADRKHDADVNQTHFDQLIEEFNVDQKALMKTLEQTHPYSHIQWTGEDIFLRDRNRDRRKGSVYEVNEDYEVQLNFVNRGMVDAQNVKAMSRVYVDVYHNDIAPRNSVEDFVKRWNAWKIPETPTPNRGDTPGVDDGRTWQAIVPEEPEVQTFFRKFTDKEMTELGSKDWSVYFLTRIEYSDATGNWRMDRCRRLKTRLNEEDPIYNSCSIFNETRMPVPTK